MAPLDQAFDENEKEMSFLDHLELLRWHIIRAVIAIGVFTIVAFVAKGFFFGQVILGPSRPDFWTYQALCKLGMKIGSEVLCIEKLPFILQSRQMTGQFTMHITSSMVIGLICAFPYAFWEIWRFIKPGLYSTEKKAARGAVFFVSLLFISGVTFGYFLLAPVSINFLANYQLDPSILNEFDIISYVSTVTILVLAAGLIFQLPVVVYFLTKAGLVTPAYLRKQRKVAIVVVMILGAMITPPDPFSQILVAVPLIGLYQVGIWISSIVVRKEAKKAIVAKLS